jgi:hypothetical protein
MTPGRWLLLTVLILVVLTGASVAAVLGLF